MLDDEISDTRSRSMTAAVIATMKPTKYKD